MNLPKRIWKTIPSKSNSLSKWWRIWVVFIFFCILLCVPDFPQWIFPYNYNTKESKHYYFLKIMWEFLHFFFFLQSNSCQEPLTFLLSIQKPRPQSGMGKTWMVPHLPGPAAQMGSLCQEEHPALSGCPLPWPPRPAGGSSRLFTHIAIWELKEVCFFSGCWVQSGNLVENVMLMQFKVQMIFISRERRMGAVGMLNHYLAPAIQIEIWAAGATWSQMKYCEWNAQNE